MTVTGICYGQSDVPLAIDHETASTSVAAQWTALGLDTPRIWTSPWARAAGLADAVGAKLRARVHSDARLAEVCFGEWEGRAYAEIEANDGPRFQAWMNDWKESAPPGGEGVRALMDRAGAWWHAIDGSPILVVTHAGPIRALRALARGVGYAEVASEPVSCLGLERIAAR